MEMKTGKQTLSLRETGMSLGSYFCLLCVSNDFSRREEVESRKRIFFVGRHKNTLFLVSWYFFELV